MDPAAIARCADATWLCLPVAPGDWVEVFDRGAVQRQAGERPSRRLDFGLLRTLPRDRIIHLEPDAIRRSPRLAASGAGRVLAYNSRGGPAVIATSRPARVDLQVLESLLRAWFETDFLGARRREDDEDRRWSRVGRRAACVAHDLAHHLTVASLEIERALADAPPEVERGFRRARAALAEARELCDHSARGAEPEAREERVGLRDLLESAADDAVTVHGRSDRAVAGLDCAAGIEVRTDRALLGRLVRNLVLNAIEASPDRSPVFVRAMRAGEGEIAVSVEDHGRGMAAASRAELLSFGRSGSGGSGVGSASVEECARALGLQLEIESRLGEGTSVRFHLRG